MPIDDAHDLMPVKIAETIPRLYATEHSGTDAPLVYLKWFTPDSSWTWYVLEYDPTERLCFGLACGHVPELGYFALDEIAAICGPLGLPVERDLCWQLTPFSQCPEYQRA